MNKRTKKILSLALAATLVSGAHTTAHAEVGNYITYTVEDGDTLGKIAYKYYGNASYYENLAEYNNMEDANVLSIGQEIKIPSNLPLVMDYNYDNNEVVVNPYEEDETYTVKEGDTLFCIVRVQYNLTNQEAVDKLATYNNLEDPNKLEVGQVLYIPCIEKLEQVVENDYTEQYNRMGYILNHKEEDKCVNVCHPKVIYVPIIIDPYLCADPYLDCDKVLCKNK